MLLLLAAMVAFLFADCGRSPFTGTWEGKLQGDPNTPAPIRHNLEIVRLELRGDMRFTLLMLSISYEGSYRVEGKTAYLRKQTALNNPVPGGNDDRQNPEAVVQIQPNGSMTLVDPGSSVRESIRLTRTSQP